MQKGLFILSDKHWGRVVFPLLFTFLYFCSAHAYMGTVSKKTSCNSALAGTIGMGTIPQFVIQGLAPEREFTVHLFSRLNGITRHSQAGVKSDKNGTIDTETMRSISGSFLGNDPMGLLWTMKPTSEVKLSKDLGENQYRLVVVRNRHVRASKDFSFIWLNKGVEQTSISLQQNKFIGNWFIPENIESNVVVVSLTGSEGGIVSSSFNAAFLANNGIPSLAVAHFGLEGLPSQLERIPLEYFQHVFDHLHTHPRFSGAKVVVMGPERGGELSLLLGAVYGVVQGVIGIAPSPYLWAADTVSHNAPAWTRNGNDMGYLAALNPPEKLEFRGGVVGYGSRSSFENALVSGFSPRALVEHINGPILLIGGGSDQVWPSYRFIRDTMDILNSGNRPYDDKALMFGNAGHDFQVPGLPTVQRVFQHPQTGINRAMGGDPRGVAQANVEAWGAILDYLMNL